MGEAGLFEGKRVELLDEESEPEPDGAPSSSYYAEGHPEPKDILLVLKIAALGEDGRLPLPGGSAIAVAELLPPR